ncbi:MAG: LacI family DNA-binding transcriptional regulator [Planctomycetes bacterium]|nr:LacI family DNA-binding transcriptional regulator [Planctomycetota bacterium]
MANKRNTKNTTISSTVRPTAREIALRCDVSVATVSRVLNHNNNNNFSVRRELCEKIIKTAKNLGYRPNLAARNLVRQRTHTIAVLGRDTTSGWPTNIYQPMCEAAFRLFQRHKYNICMTAPNMEMDDTELPPWRVDGVIVIQECSPETIDEMERTRLPYVVVNGVGGPSCSTVAPDDIDATQRAMRYLLELGHKRIAYAGPLPKHREHISMSDRRQTYLSELDAAGLEPVSGAEALVKSGLDFLVSAVLKQKATAIVAYDHVVAMKIVHDANILSIKIPGQVSLLCFNDERICDLVVPPLTTVGVPSYKMGEIAAELLLKKIESPEENHPPECIKLQEDLIIRSSTIKPPIDL